MTISTLSFGIPDSTVGMRGQEVCSYLGRLVSSVLEGYINALVIEHDKLPTEQQQIVDSLVSFAMEVAAHPDKSVGQGFSSEHFIL